ncbi:hypothetical protein ACF090_03220 [Streptomyces sp. NPDC014892]|uniref:hypothetical protein n=1 Tax=Streptomyces sp. NPDC014892 TaxID=3364930 RepID=UPI0036FF200C
MSDAAHQTSRDRAVALVRGYVDQDRAAVGEALEGPGTGAGSGGLIEVYVVLNGLLRSTISIMELSGRPWKVDDLVGRADELAASAPPHYEFAVGEATRAWARGDQSAMRAASCQDLTGAVHITAVGVAVLGSALWGEAGFLAVLREFGAVASASADDPSFLA